MLETAKYIWNVTKFINYATRLARAVESKNTELMRTYHNMVMKHGKRALELSEIVNRKPDDKLQGFIQLAEQLYDLATFEYFTGEYPPTHHLFN